MVPTEAHTRILLTLFCQWHSPLPAFPIGNSISARDIINRRIVISNSKRIIVARVACVREEAGRLAECNWEASPARDSWGESSERWVNRLLWRSICWLSERTGTETGTCGLLLAVSWLSSLSVISPLVSLINNMALFSPTHMASTTCLSVIGLWCLIRSFLAVSSPMRMRICSRVCFPSCFNLMICRIFELYQVQEILIEVTITHLFRPYTCSSHYSLIHTTHLSFD